MVVVARLVPSVEEKAESTLEGLFDGVIYIHEKDDKEDKAEIGEKEKMDLRKSKIDGVGIVSSL